MQRFAFVYAPKLDKGGRKRKKQNSHSGKLLHTYTRTLAVSGGHTVWMYIERDGSRLRNPVYVFIHSRRILLLLALQDEENGKFTRRRHHHHRRVSPASVSTPAFRIK